MTRSVQVTPGVQKRYREVAMEGFTENMMDEEDSARRKYYVWRGLSEAERMPPEDLEKRETLVCFRNYD